MVLLVEDEEVNRQVLSGLLRRSGHRVVIAKDGPEALTAFESHRVDAVLVDLRLPGMDGYEVSRRLLARATERAEPLPILAVTANLMPDIFAACRRAGMSGVLGKPIDSARLDRALAVISSGENAVGSGGRRHARRVAQRAATRASAPGGRRHRPAAARPATAQRTLGSFGRGGNPPPARRLPQCAGALSDRSDRGD
ncbi:response regulator [Elstera litoralis]|uniref:response regulator n=1 Tax=Elstera litoralis TaxID=552518 RepID=UPI0006981071|nr:response regulator [Elstera litoralis]